MRINVSLSLILVFVALGCVSKPVENASLDAYETTSSTTLKTTIEETTTVTATSTVAQTTTIAVTTIVVETTTLTATSTTSSSTSTTSTTLPPREVIFKKDGSYRLTMTFVGLDGKKHTAHLDSGPFEKGDEFMMKGRVYRYNGYETDKTNNLKVELRDITSFNKETFTLSPKTGGPIKLTTYAFLDASANDEEITLDPEAAAEDTSVYGGSVLGVPALSDDGTLYLGVDGTTKTVVGVNADVAGSQEFKDIQLSQQGVGVSIVAEKGKNINGAKGDVTDDDSDDVFVVVHESGMSEKFFYVDFYDRNYVKGEITNSVKMASSLATADSIGKTFYDMDTPEENFISNFPVVLYKYNITYGSGNEITEVSVHT